MWQHILQYKRYGWAFCPIEAEDSYQSLIPLTKLHGAIFQKTDSQTCGSNSSIFSRDSQSLSSTTSRGVPKTFNENTKKPDSSIQIKVFHKFLNKNNQAWPSNILQCPKCPFGDTAEWDLLLYCMVTVRIHTGSEEKLIVFLVYFFPYKYDNGIGHVINEVLAT